MSPHCKTCGQPLPHPDGTLVDRVRKYVKRHPGSTAKDVRLALDEPSLRVRATLYELARRGDLHAVSFGPRNTRFYFGKPQVDQRTRHGHGRKVINDMVTLAVTGYDTERRRRRRTK